MINSAKRAIFAELSDAEVNDEELKSICAEVEGLLNSRPLTAVSDETNGDRVLTPNHFLIGQMGAILYRRVWTPNHLTSESAGEEFKSSQDMCANDGRKNSYHRSDQAEKVLQ